MMQDGTIKPIPTAFLGHQYRSRLEARWGVFLHTLGIEYRYEPEGFDLDGIWYLPDFYLPQLECWIEIKPGVPTGEEQEKAIRLCLSSGKSVFLLSGDAWSDVRCTGYVKQFPTTCSELESIFEGFGIHWLTDDECVMSYDLYPPEIWLSGWKIKREYSWSRGFWAECAQCSKVMLYAPPFLLCQCGVVGYHKVTSRLTEAYTAARQARFEHGEKPRGRQQ